MHSDKELSDMSRGANMKHLQTLDWEAACCKEIVTSFQVFNMVSDTVRIFCAILVRHTIGFKTPFDGMCNW